MPDEIQEWFEACPPERREEVEELATQVRSAAGLAEAVKWKRLTFTADEDWHHWVCAVAVSRKQAALVFHKGALLEDPAGLLVGDGKYTRQVPHERALADPAAVQGLVRSALGHQHDMLD